MVSIDEERKIIYVARIKSNRIPAWAGTGGDIHDKVVKRTKKVLQEDEKSIAGRYNIYIFTA